VFDLVTEAGPVEAVRALRAGVAGGRATALAEARRRQDRAADDLAEAHRIGARLVTPEDREWPDQALRAMQVAYDREHGSARRGDGVELTPPLALWVLGEPRTDLPSRPIHEHLDPRPTIVHATTVATCPYAPLNCRGPVAALKLGRRARAPSPSPSVPR